MAVKRANNPDQGMVLVLPVDHSLQACRGLCDGCTIVRCEQGWRMLPQLKGLLRLLSFQTPGQWHWKAVGKTELLVRASAPSRNNNTPVD